MKHEIASRFKHLLTRGETLKNYTTIGSLELKLFVALAEGMTIRKQQTRYHHVVDGEVVTTVDETKPTYYYANDFSLPCIDPYAIAMEFYLKAKSPPEENT